MDVVFFENLAVATGLILAMFIIDLFAKRWRRMESGPTNGLPGK